MFMCTDNFFFKYLDADSPCSGSDPIDRHHPIHKLAEPRVSRVDHVLVPSLTLPPPIAASRGQPKTTSNTDTDTNQLDEHAASIYEWLSLVSLNSPRVRSDDEIDPYLSRYVVPDVETATRQSLVRVRWNGLLPVKWISDLWSKTLSVSFFFFFPLPFFDV